MSRQPGCKCMVLSGGAVSNEICPIHKKRSRRERAWEQLARSKKPIDSLEAWDQEQRLEDIARET